MKKVLLLGAGFSYELGMPLAMELTKIFLGTFTEENSKRFIELLALNDPFGSDRPINKSALNEAMSLVLEYKKSNGVNYEELLANIQKLGGQPKRTLSDKDSYHYIFGVFYSLIHEILNYYQLLSYSKVYIQNFPTFRKLDLFCSDEETWVFTLNHDMFLECLALDLKIPVTYGDSHEIRFPVNNKELEDVIDFTYSCRDELGKGSASYFKGQRGINLVKLHGGLSELEYNDGKQILNQSLSLENSIQLMTNFMKIQEMSYYEGNQKIPCGKDKFVTNHKGELDIVVQSMLTGGSKYSLTTNEKQGEEKLKLFLDNLKGAEELIIIGYGFGDKHINYRISNAMVLNENLKVTIVDPIHKPIPELLEQFNYNTRIKPATCGAPHWLEYIENETWSRELTEHLEKNSDLRKSVFDLVAQKFCG
ncbi:hypothetical protein [Vibrio atlanticus]|uniref:hypothetical protein n=1 Tax=Vibrio atlanticus TaxID=693153 RepID=UPI00354F97D4